MKNNIDCTVLFMWLLLKQSSWGGKNKGTSNLNNGFKLIASRNLLLTKKINNMTIWLKTSKPTSARNLNRESFLSDLSRNSFS